VKPAIKQKTKNAMNMIKPEDNQNSNDLKITEEPNLYNVENSSSTIKPSE